MNDLRNLHKIKDTAWQIYEDYLQDDDSTVKVGKCDAGDFGSEIDKIISLMLGVEAQAYNALNVEEDPIKKEILESLIIHLSSSREFLLPFSAEEYDRKVLNWIRSRIKRYTWR